MHITEKHTTRIEMNAAELISFVTSQHFCGIEADALDVRIVALDESTFMLSYTIYSECEA